jgi:hypothetical protein
VKRSAFKARFADKDITPNKEEANTINQRASSIRNCQKRQRANTFFIINRQKVKRICYKTCDKPHNISKC